jgi:ABC-type multidrug transport system fused ATPase/permease subunit
VIVVVISVIVIAVLLSLSFMTIIPLLKVMIGSEGLHGWADRKTCQYYYGLDLHVPKTIELTSGQDPNLGQHLLVLDVESDSLAAIAGIKPGDLIVGVGSNQSPTSFTRLLEELATTTDSKVIVRLNRSDANKTVLEQTVSLNTPHNKESLAGLPGNTTDSTGRTQKYKLITSLHRTAWTLKIKLVTVLQRLVSSLPREQSPQNQIRAVVFLMVTISLVTIVRCAAKFWQDYLAEKIVQVGINRLREDVFEHLTLMPVGFFANERPSDTVSRIAGDTVIMGQALKVILGKALREPMNAFFMLAFAMVLNWKLTLIFLCGAPFVIAFLATFGNKMKKATKKSLVASSQMLAKLQETVSGLRIVKVYNQQQHEQQAFRKINKTLLKQLLSISRVDAATHPTLEVLGMIAGSAAIIVGVHWVAQGNIDGPEFLTLLVLLGVSADAVRKTSDIWNKLQQANAAAERVFAVLDRPTEVEKPTAIELPPLKGEVEFRDVFFTYPGATNPTLKGVNLSVHAGHNVAIVGPNGSGKTTLANLIPRFYDPDSGQVLIDRYNIRDITRSSLRNQMGMVTQDMMTFNDTIAANIAYGKPGATDDEVIAAAKRAFAHEFICQLANGYDTVIGEHGAGLSGGQLQRIAIARAILKNPPILIFDEATSQVDADSEAKIHSAIEEIMHDRTTFIIAHRFSTVVTADVIVVMDDGRIVAQGHHNQLMQTCSLYQGLYETQLVKA